MYLVLTSMKLIAAVCLLFCSLFSYGQLLNESQFEIQWAPRNIPLNRSDIRLYTGDGGNEYRNSNAIGIRYSFAPIRQLSVVFGGAYQRDISDEFYSEPFPCLGFPLLFSETLNIVNTLQLRTQLFLRIINRPKFNLMAGTGVELLKPFSLKSSRKSTYCDGSTNTHVSSETIEKFYRSSVLLSLKTNYFITQHLGFSLEINGTRGNIRLPYFGFDTGPLFFYGFDHIKFELNPSIGIIYRINE